MCTTVILPLMMVTEAVVWVAGWGWMGVSLVHLLGLRVPPVAGTLGPAVLELEAAEGGGEGGQRCG